MLSVKLGPPYAPPANIRSILNSWRDRGMPARIDRDWFVRVGLSANLTTRNLHALRYLRLVDDEHRPTELAERLRIEAAGNFAGRFATAVRTAYADVWAICDPAVESRGRIEDAFRHADPPAQRARMVACFIGLCELAAIRTSLRGSRRTPSNASLRAHSQGGKAFLTREIAAPEPPPRDQLNGPTRDTLELLLAKFPDFDPAWPDGIKEKWFDAFARLRAELR